MSEMSEKARAAAKEKAKRLTSGGGEKVDASGYGEAPCGFMHSEKKLGNRPISKQNLATGGKASHKHGGRKPRQAGGSFTSNEGQPLVASVPAIPQNRFSFSGQNSPMLGAAGLKKGGRAKHRNGGQAEHWIAGAIKHPGALHKELHVPEGEKIPAKKLKKAEHSSNPTERKRADFSATLKKMHKADGGMAALAGARPKEGGRIPRASGGKAGKGKMNVNIIIAQKPDHPAMPPGAPPPHPMAPMMPPPAAGPAPQGMPAGPIPGGPNMPPPSMGTRPPMPPGRASGGKVYPIKDGSGSGEGRLEKAKAYR